MSFWQMVYKLVNTGCYARRAHWMKYRIYYDAEKDQMITEHLSRGISKEWLSMREDCAASDWEIF